MLNIRQKVDTFLCLHEMHYKNIDIEQSVRTYIDEMDKGLKGQESSLMMIPTYIKMERDITVDKPVIVIDAGGTNFRRAVVYFGKDKKPVIENLKVYPMPGTKGAITKEEFFETVAGYIEPILDRSNKISFCFSYPTEIYPNLDGKLLKFNKEVQVKGAEGEMIAENLLKGLKNRGCKQEKEVIILNDTVATLLGGRAVQPDRKFDDYIGFIFGTGTNTSYLEDYANIKKISRSLPEQGAMLINMESGGYGRAKTGSIDDIFDKSTANPGEHIFEKMVSGGYQGGLMLEVLRTAAKEKLFCVQTANRLLELKELSAVEIDYFLDNPYGDNTLAICCASKNDDAMAIYYLIDAIIERAATLVTVNLSAVILKRSKGYNPCIPICISAEGTTFYKSRLFKTKLEYNMRNYLVTEKGIYCKFVQTDSTTLVGTAIAGLSN